ncbi:MAG: glycosyltransferase [Muribaculaceae bacterium]|nr:glycosyltransferase [Muribaculaceae bacterium]
MKFSLIVPVFNRADEVQALLESLDAQTDRGFECIIVEDGSSLPCRKQCDNFSGHFPLKYFHKDNEGRSIARNYGIDRADGDYLVFVDSDCILPPDYFASLRRALEATGADCFGGPDAAHDSFTPLQKAINFAMTSFLTTGGIRGGKVQLEKFVPRTFNMGFSREVYNRVGGFREMFSEDIDMSTRIRRAGYAPVLLRDVRVYHKRRVSLRKFWRQVHVFGMSRITLQLLYPGSMKLVHWLPALFVVGSAALIVGSIFFVLAIVPLLLYLLLIFITASISMKSLRLGAMAVVTSVIQLWGYGTGFLRAYFLKIILRRGRNIQEEIEIRKGK